MSKLICLFPCLREYANIFWLLDAFNTNLRQFLDQYIKPTFILCGRKNESKAHGIVTGHQHFVLRIESTGTQSAKLKDFLLGKGYSTIKPGFVHLKTRLIKALLTTIPGLFSLTLSFGQTSTFDNLNANPLTNKAITWISSNYGNGFGHRIVNSDPGFFTLLNFQGRHNNSSWSNIMSLTSDGKVGIGTTAPDSKLHIYIPTGSTLYPTSTSKGNVVQSVRSHNNGLEIGNSLGFNDRKAWILARHSSVQSLGQYYSALHMQPDVGDKTYYRGVAIGYDASTNIPVGTHLAVNGKVGIGTLNPDSELTVKGKIHAEEVKVDLSVPGPDYVFKEDYKLKSLKEVQSYIKEHGHLPNIPPAKEMEENGIDLGEINMKLLEKIEELTLYMIELENKTQQIKSLEGQLKQNRKEIEQLKNVIKKSNQ